MPRYDVPNAAPEPLRLVQRFVNTADHEHHRDVLTTPRELTDWLAASGLARRARATTADVRRARELREALRALLVANREDGTPPPRPVAVLNRAAQDGRVSVELGSDGQAAITVAGHGVRGALARVVAVVFTAMLDGGWSRLKACRNCDWAFYDYSRNRSATWCSMRICGNRLKTRRYRQRRTARETGTDIQRSGARTRPAVRRRGTSQGQAHVEPA